MFKWRDYSLKWDCIFIHLHFHRINGKITSFLNLKNFTEHFTHKFIYFWDRVSCSLHWSWTPDSPASTSKCWITRVRPGVPCAGNQSQDFLRSSWALFSQSHIANTHVSVLLQMVVCPSWSLFKERDSSAQALILEEVGRKLYGLSFKIRSSVFSLISRSWKSPYHRSRVQNRAARQRDEQRRAGTRVHLAETSNVLFFGRVVFLFVCICVCMSACHMCTCRQVPKEVSRGCGSSGAIAPGCCESSDMGART